jgi:uroporphyrinogen decarboxylase
MSGQYLAAITSENSQIPVWMMRQAGRYLPEYRKIRQQHSFLEMVYTPSVAADITCQPIRRFGFDAAILFSDILVTPQALGMALRFTEGIGPEFPHPIRNENDVQSLKQDINILGPIYETVQLVRAQLPPETALIGFAGAPFTVASYMIEGGSSKDLKHTKKMMVSDPKLFQEVLDQVLGVTIDYLDRQVRAGAQALQIFDTWISHLDWDACEEYSAQYVKKIVTELRQRGISVPITFFGKQTSVFYPLYAGTGVNVISVDWNGNIGRIDADLDPSIGLQGNLDPFMLYGPKDVIQKKVHCICNAIQSGRPFVFNLGHGLMPDIPIDAVQWVIDAVRSYSTTATVS